MRPYLTDGRHLIIRLNTAVVYRNKIHPRMNLQFTPEASALFDKIPQEKLEKLMGKFPDLWTLIGYLQYESAASAAAEVEEIVCDGPNLTLVEVKPLKPAPEPVEKWQPDRKAWRLLLRDFFQLCFSSFVLFLYYKKYGVPSMSEE